MARDVTGRLQLGGQLTPDLLWAIAAAVEVALAGRSAAVTLRSDADGMAADTLTEADERLAPRRAGHVCAPPRSPARLPVLRL
ncbi:MAG: hypothetical protein ACRDNZ_22600 [Streptosporangiaceae bacterium]